jgi:hypothetical protein
MAAVMPDAIRGPGSPGAAPVCRATRPVRGATPAASEMSAIVVIPANISTVTGVHNVYLEFVSSAPGSPASVSPVRRTQDH